jgi:hypothetical protein
VNRPFALALTALCLGACSSPRGETSAASSSAVVVSGSWCHDYLAATDGTQIALDYQTQGGFNSAGSFRVSPLWINVRSEGLGASDHVRAVLIDITGNLGEVVQTQQIDLSYAGPGWFTGQTTLDTSLNDFQQIAVVADGAWQKDPISGGSNFEFNLGDDFPSACNTSSVIGADLRR